MKNWRTTVTGVATALFGFVMFSPQYFPPWMVDLAKYATIGGLAMLGIVGKDFNVHSTVEEVQSSTIKAESAKIATP